MNALGDPCAACGRRRRCHPHQVHGVAIVGTMKTGKSSLFARLCGRDRDTFRIPGGSAELGCGRVMGADLVAIDTPGILSIFSRNEDECASHDLLLGAGTTVAVDGLVVVVDAKNIRRSLAVVLQYAEYGLPMLLAVNMTDEAGARGIRVDCGRLAKRLGVEVVPTVAADGFGVNRLRARLGTMTRPQSPVRHRGPVAELVTLLGKLLMADGVDRSALALRLLNADPAAERYVAERAGPMMARQLTGVAVGLRRGSPEAFAAQLTQLYSEHARVIAEEVTATEAPSGSRWLTTLGDWCTRPATGIPIALAVLTAMYLFLGPIAASLLSGTVTRGLIQGYLIPLTTALAEPLGANAARELLVDPDFGLLPVGLLLPAGAVLPVMFCFFLAFVALEDSGYLPRVSVLLNGLLRRLGLNARAIVPLTMGFSCITMAILSTRVLERERERNIASFLLMLAMPCAPLMAVIMILLEPLPISATVAVFGLVILHLVLGGWAVNRILPGARALLLMELPPLRLPRLRSIVFRAALRTWHFAREALPVFVLAAVILFVFHRVGGLELLARFLRPVIVDLLGLPEQAVQVFLKTLVRRETGALELNRLRGGYTQLQLVVAVVAITFTVPCLNAVVVLFKERGPRAALAIVAAVFAYALLLAGGLNHLCLGLGITFS